MKSYKRAKKTDYRTTYKQRLSLALGAKQNQRPPILWKNGANNVQDI